MRGFLIAVTFLTRLPFPAPQDVTPEEFTAAQRYYPLVGLLIGLILAVSALFFRLFYPPMVTAAFLLIEELLLTGGIHMDGFMDSMDALWSARSPERMLEIMKDSRVGAFGALSAIALLLLKYSLLASLHLSHPAVLSPSSVSSVFTPPFSSVSLSPSPAVTFGGAFFSLLLMPVLSRWMFLIGVLFYPYARASGLGKGFHETSLKKPFLFSLEGLICFALAVYFLGWAGATGFGLSLIFLLIYTRKTASLLGGLTGDLYGASIELAEILFLIGVIPFLQN